MNISYAPTPWRIGKTNPAEIWGADDCRVAQCIPDNQYSKPYGQTVPNAAFICRAVNNHEALVAALIYHRDALDLGCVKFYEKHGFNSAEVMPRTRNLLARQRQP